MSIKFKIQIGYPPLSTEKGTPLLSQNRQFQYFNSPTFIYPMVPAYAASLLQEKGYEVSWVDGIAEQQNYETWFANLELALPDFLVIETKTPVIKRHWQIIDELKTKLPTIKVILVGDHVTWNPEESFANCKVDYIITGGDYDFALAGLMSDLQSGTIQTGGIWYRAKTTCQLTLSSPLTMTHDLDELPFIDRVLTKWQLYAYQNGNYKYTPATYMYSARDCWWNRCTFCVWDHTLYPRGSYRKFSPERLFAEVKAVVDNYQVKEIFDDAGTFYIGPALKKFCELMIESGYNKKVVYGCNMRLNALGQSDYNLMKQAGFRFLLYGMESANQDTLNKIDKGLRVEEIEQGVNMAKEAGLEPHVTVMLGYPWETEEMAKNTINLSKKLFDQGYIDTMQATIVIPYPGTPLYKECVEKDLLQVGKDDYETFDMRAPVMKIPFSNDRLLKLTRDLYSSFFNIKFIYRKIVSIRSFADIKYLFSAGIKYFGHILDFWG
jgi:anaerobic magnesium-protoporphyrin IX monomethyl ester cyclase